MRKKGTVYRKMIVSFLGVVLVPLCLSVIFFFFSQRVFENQMISANENFIRTIRSALDRELQYYRNTMYQLSMNETIKNASKLDFTDGETQMTLSKLMTSIGETRTSVGLLGDDCIDVFVYFPENDRVFSAKAGGSMQYEHYMTEYFFTDRSDAAAMKEHLSSYSRFEMESVEKTRLGKKMLLMTCGGAHNGSKSTATIGIWLDIDGLISRTASFEWSDGYNWMILDSDYSVVIDPSDSYHAGETVSIEELAHNGDYLIYSDSSSSFDWIYALMVPKEILQSSVGEVRTFFMICLILSVIIASVLILKVTAINYKPLNNLLRDLQPKSEQDGVYENEYYLLKKRINELIDARDSAETFVSAAAKPMLQWGLTNLLLRPYEQREDKDGKRLEEYARMFSGGENLVLRIKEQDDAGKDTVKTLPDGLKKFVVENVFLERIGEICHCEMTEIENHQILVLHAADIRSHAERIREAVFELQEIISENFGFRALVSGGSSCYGPEGLHKSYLEACEAEEFIPILEQDYIVYEEIMDVTCRGYRYSLQEEERISAAVRSDNALLAIALIHKAVDDSWSDQTSPRIRRLFLNDLYCTLLKTADEKGCIDKVQDFSVLLAGRTVEEIKAAFSQIVDTICVERNTKPNNSADKILCEKVLEYVREHYSDSSLNVSQTAFYFHISPANLSTIYKNEMGKSLLTSINEVRIENALAFLKQGYTVAETAALVGVPESSSFIRLFKKYVGMTPGKIKENMDAM